MIVTIFSSLYDKTPHHIPIDRALERIRDGKSADKVQAVRAAIDRSKRDALKKDLPVVIFSGKFSGRGDNAMMAHSGFIVLDFDKVDEPGEKMAQMAGFAHTYAAWISPTGTGVKALIKIADGSQHRKHFDALREVFPDADASGVNEERLCYESHDEHMYINPDATAFTKLLTVEKMQERFDATKGDHAQVFQRLLKWMANKGNAFVDGERNKFVFRLAGGCCRFGMDAEDAARHIAGHFGTSSDFTMREVVTTVKSAYKRNVSQAGTCTFEGERMVDRKRRTEVKLEDIADYDPEAPPKDIIYAASVKESAMDFYDNGNEHIKGIGINDIDELWKMMRGQVTALTGIGNYGKSALYKWYFLMRCLLYGERFAAFAPEDNPARDYFIDYVEMLLACDCSPSNPNRPPRQVYERAYDWVGQHIFLLAPENDDPTPEYIKERFLEVIVKEQIAGVCIDPFNQLSHEYGARSDKYLEKLLGDFSRFAQKNDIYFLIVTHPKTMAKNANGNYPCPDVFDINDGAMWNNKMDNILVYHRPLGQTEPNNPTCEFHAKKIKKKSVGRKGSNDFRYVSHKRRFEFGSTDPMEVAMRNRCISFEDAMPVAIPNAVPEFDPERLKNFWNETD